MGAAMNKGLTLKMGQTHVKRYLPELSERSIQARSIRRSSLRIIDRLRKGLSFTARFATRKMVALKWY